MKLNRYKLILFLIICSSLSLSAQNVWVERAKFPMATYGSDGFVIGDTAYVGLGFSGSTYEKYFYKYSINEDKWYSIPPIPGRGRKGGAVFSIGEYGYVCTGWTGNSPSEHLRDCYRYSPKTGTWTKLKDYPGYATDDVQFFVLNGKAYVCGGYNIATPINETWEYNPENDTWTQKANMIDGIARGEAFTDGVFGYVVCGQASKLNRNKSLYRYDQFFDKWDKVMETPLDETLFPFSFFINGKAYIGGGWVNYSSQFWEFDPQNNTFRKLNNLQTDIHACATFVLHGRAFMQTASTVSYYKFMEYMPSSNYIRTDSVSRYVFCEDTNSCKVYFTANGNFNSDNEFQMEMTEDLYNYQGKSIMAKGKTSPFEFSIPKDFQDNYRCYFRINSTSPKVYGNYTINTATILHYPKTPVLELRHDTIFITNYGLNFWFKDGKPYDTTTTRFLKVKEPGVYKLYYGDKCSSQYSNEIVYNPTSVMESINDIGAIFPNPATDFIKIKIPVGVQLAVPKEIEIYDIMGERIPTTPSTTLPPLQTEGELKFDVSGFMPGVYFVKIGEKVHRFVKV